MRYIEKMVADEGVPKEETRMVIDQAFTETITGRGR